MIFSLMSTTLLTVGVAGAPSTPLNFLKNRQTNTSPVIHANFPDPSILQDGDTWYAFGTNSGGHNVQVATAPAVGGPYTVLDQDLLPNVGSWSDGLNVWAPDVRKIGKKYVLYYTAESSQDAPHHCVGTATLDAIEGPYTPASTPLACTLDQGGAIDPSGFTDIDDTHYVVYKTDGNSIGHGGNCNNAVAPIVPTPIMLQKVASDGFTPVGDPIQILNRDHADGPLVEAPDLILVNGVYVLFFSSNCFDSTLYDISWATASSVLGPYTKNTSPAAPLAVTNKPFAVTSPGGATATTDGKHLVFHANCDPGRCMFVQPISISRTTVAFG